MAVTVYHYSRCGTCRKALAWLDTHGVAYAAHDLVASPPGPDELRELIRKSGVPLRRWFNTSGQRYRELELKDRVEGMGLEEAVELLASDGMLIRRPIVTDGKRVTVGFDPKAFEAWLR